MSTRGRTGLLILAGALTLTACSGEKVDNDAGDDDRGSDLSFAVVTHGASGDAFWDIVKAGAEQAASDLGSDLSYQGSGEPQEQSTLIDNAVSQDVDGIVVSMANPDALRESIEKAVSAGIPVITINSGEDRSAEFGALTHIGQSESVAGEAAGNRFRQAGARKVLCVVHEAGNIGLDQRCAGAQKTFGGGFERLQVEISNLDDVTAKIGAKIRQDPSIDAILTLNGGVANAAAIALQDADSPAKLGTFDLNADVISLIKEDKLLFAVDQQPYLQGYLGVNFLYLYNINRNTVGGGEPVLTGPSFVTKDNVDDVGPLAEDGTR